MNVKGFSLEKENEQFFDWKLIFIVIVLVLIGIISLYSATYASNMQETFNRQLISIGFGILVAVIMTFIPQNAMRNLSFIFYFGSLILLIAVLFFGNEIYGTKGWIRFAGMSLQPAEFAKFGIITMLAYFKSSKGIELTNIRDFSIATVIVFVPMALVFIQPDHGTSSVLIAIFLGILFWSGFSAFFLFFVVSLPFIIILSLKGMWFMIIAIILFTGFALLFKTKWLNKSLVIFIFIISGYFAPIFYNTLQDHQKARIETFLNPGADPRGQGYNVIQSMMAVGSGGITGKGFLQGTQTQLRYIPMQWTDFIYSVPAEEFGFIGSIAIIIFFGLLLLKILDTAKEADDEFYSISAFGILTVFLYHTIINIGMVIGIVPVMGIPLPFLSYGGTSMIVNFAFIGLLLNAYRNHRKKRLV